jgi:hypothetical protein
MFEIDSIIPEKCHSCPALIESQVHIDDHETEVDVRIQDVTSEKVDRFAADFVDTVHATIGFDSEGFNPESIARGIREAGSDEIESINRCIAGVQASMADLAFRCPGPVVLTGEHNRRAYEVKICASPKAVEAQVEPAVVKRSRI